MRVLFVDHETRLSGGQRDLVDLVRGLAPHGVNVHVALPGRGTLADALAAEGAIVHVVSMGAGLRRVSRWGLARRPWAAARFLGSAAASSRRLRQLARELRPDVVHSNSLKAHLLSVRAARAVRAPLVWHMRDILDEGPLRRWFTRAAGRYADAVVCISEACARPFAQTPAGDKTTVVYNGVRPGAAAREAVSGWRTKLGAGDGAALVGMVGQIAHWKGQDVFIDAAAKVVTELPHARFVITGECLFPENEAAYERDLRRRTEEAGLDGHLTFTGPVTPVGPLMAACDVVAHASRLPEPFGRVIVEAMAQGTPVVTTAVGAGPELVPADAGRVIPPGDADALARALLELLDHPEALTAMGAAARARAAEFDISRTATGVLAVWHALLRT